jgi:hypothetical protein
METRIMLILAVAGVCILAIWYINGALVTPVVMGRNLRLQICVSASGEAPELEHAVDGLLWLLENGTLSGEILIRDEGMDDYTRMTAELLARDDSRIHFIKV